MKSYYLGLIKFSVANKKKGIHQNPLRDWKLLNGINRQSISAMERKLNFFTLHPFIIELRRTLRRQKEAFPSGNVNFSRLNSNGSGVVCQTFQLSGFWTNWFVRKKFKSIIELYWLVVKASDRIKLCGLNAIYVPYHFWCLNPLK